MIRKDFWSAYENIIKLIGTQGTVKRATKSSQFVLQHELITDVACFTTHENKPYNLISCKTGSNMGGKTRNIAISAAMLQNKLHVFCCPFYCSFSLVLCSFFGVQTSVLIQNYVDFGQLFLGIIIHFVQVWSFL